MVRTLTPTPTLALALTPTLTPSRSEGPSGFYRGFSAHYLRVRPHARHAAWLGLGVRVSARVTVKVSLALPVRSPACSTRGRPCSSSALASLTRILRRLFSYCCALLAMQVGPHYVLTFVILEQLRKLAR